MINNLEWLYPKAFALSVLPILWWLFWPAFKFRASALLYPDFNNSLAYTASTKQKKALVKKQNGLSIAVLSIIWVLLTLTVAQPVEVGQPQLQIKTSRNFLLVCDISYSMARKDWELDNQKVRRWDAVKEVMHQFILDREGDRMGLMFFGSSAYVQCPFTTDLNVVDTLLEQADVGMAGQMTNIGKAIVKGAAMFANDTLKTKVMLLLTDGVDSGTDILPLDAAALAKEDSIIIYTLGIGTTQNTGSDLDEVTLQEISKLTGGQYFKAATVKDLDKVYKVIDELEPMTFEEEKYVPKTPLYHYTLFAALALWIGWLGVQMLMTLLQKREGI